MSVEDGNMGCPGGLDMGSSRSWMVLPVPAAPVGGKTGVEDAGAGMSLLGCNHQCN